MPEITRDHLDRAEERVTLKVQKAHDRIDDIAERTTRVEVLIDQTDKDFKRLEGAVVDVASELRSATGALSKAMLQEARPALTAAEIVAALKATETDGAETASWRRAWREAATPANMVRLAFALVAFGTVIGAFMKGQADVQDLRSALEATNTIAPILAPAPAPAPVAAPVQPDAAP